MKPHAIQIGILLILSAFRVSAQGLSEQNPIHYPEMKAAVETSETLVPETHLTVGLAGGVRRVQLLADSGFVGTSPDAPTLILQSSLRIPHSERQSVLSFELGQTEYRHSLSPLTPDLLRENRLDLRYENLTRHDGWNWGFLLAAEKTRATESSPSPLIASRTLLWAGAVFEKSDFTNSIFDLRTAILLPFSQSEDSASSGRFQSGGRLEGRIRFAALQFREARLLWGAELNLTKLNFQGLDRRGSENASETQFDFRIPLALEWTWH